MRAAAAGVLIGVLAGDAVLGAGTAAQPALGTATAPGADRAAAGPRPETGSDADAGPVGRSTAAPQDRAAWLLVAGSIGFATVGAVLTYSSDSAENDLKDLYVGFAGQPPTFDARTRRTYDALVAEGERYERLAWLSFGLAGASGIAAAILFWRGHEGAHAPRVTPSVTRDGASVRATLRF